MLHYMDKVRSTNNSKLQSGYFGKQIMQFITLCGYFGQQTTQCYTLLTLRLANNAMLYSIYTARPVYATLYGQS